MFYLTYLRRELQRRKRQAIVIAIGLAVGIGLVVTVSAASGGVKKAQSAVLQALYGIGTDVVVTTAPPNPAKLGSPGASKFGFTPGNKPQHVDNLGLPADLGLLNQSSVAQVARLRGVGAAAGGLVLTDTSLTVPSISQMNSGKPPASAFPTTYTVDGVDLAHTRLGPFAAAKISSGHGFAASDATSKVAVVDSSYAKAHKLTVGSTIDLASNSFKVIGIVSQPQGGGAADVYIPLGRAQALAQFQGSKNLNGKVDSIYVSATSATAVSAVQKEIATLLPEATVTSSASLASAVSGSLASAASLATDLGRWLAIAALAAAFAVASLLTMAAVARRVREFGTLKALGWRSRRIVSQLMGESLIVGLLGAAAGTALGFGGAALVRALAPKLSATVAQNPGSPLPYNVRINANGIQRSVAPGATHTVAIHLTAPVTLGAIGLAVLLAIAGGLIAGAFGGWRAARLRPAEALGRVE
jgi:putative ABC transport system permease protein